MITSLETEEKQREKANKVNKGQFQFLSGLGEIWNILSEKCDLSWKKLDSDFKNKIKLEDRRPLPSRPKLVPKKEGSESWKLNPKENIVPQGEASKNKGRERTFSQNNRFRSSKKNAPLNISKEEEERKVERLKEIMNRKMELMEKLKRIDAELVDARKEISFSAEKSQKNQSFISKNQSFLGNSRQKTVVDNLENHSKAIDMISKLNSEKMKRQERLAEEMHRKQQAELLKIQELEKKRNEKLEERRKRAQIHLPKPNRNNTQVLTPIKTKINEFSDQNDHSMIPTTFLRKTNDQKSERKSLESNEFLNEFEQPLESFSQKSIENSSNNGAKMIVDLEQKSESKEEMKEESKEELQNGIHNEEEEQLRTSELKVSSLDNDEKVIENKSEDKEPEIGNNENEENSKEHKYETHQISQIDSLNSQNKKNEKEQNESNEKENRENENERNEDSENKEKIDRKSMENEEKIENTEKLEEKSMKILKETENEESIFVDIKI